MAKDPAFLFYPGDWNLGTMHLTLLEKGCYIELLVLQFAKGQFTEAQAKHMLNGSFDLAWPTLREKFKTDGTFFWNERLKLEKEKRQKFTDSRKSNGSVKKQPEHMPKHMEDININRNESVVELKDSGKWNSRPSKESLDLDLDEVKAGAVKKYFELAKKQHITNDQIKSLWQVFKEQHFDGVRYYGSPTEAHSHFVNWSYKQTINGTHQQSTPANGARVTKSSGAEKLVDILKTEIRTNAGRKEGS